MSALANLGVPPDPLKQPVQAALIEHDPVVIVFYLLMKRGTVIDRTMDQVVTAVRDGAPETDVWGPREVQQLARAREFAGRLPYGLQVD